MPGPAESFVDAVLEVVADIPPGRVMTYGQIAAVLGSRGARVVGQVMALYGSDVP
ncbi:MAG: MGMT family protein, partial [Humibacter sp.]